MRSSRLAKDRATRSTGRRRAIGNAKQQGDEMNTSSPKVSQREALKSSEKKASEKQPGSFKDEATEEKIVEIPPVGPDRRPIRGLDPK